MKDIPEKYKIFSSYSLKIIALLCMITDHLCQCLFPFSINAYRLSLTIGRIAMPIYVFLMVEGFFFTGNKWKYFLRLLIFGFISEPFFNLALYSRPFSFAHQNVFFSLALSLLMLIILERFFPYPIGVPQLLVIIAFSVFCGVMNFDYQFCAPIMAAIFYVFRKSPNYVKSLAGCSVLTFFYSGIEVGAFLSVPLISLYSPKKIKPGKGVKYLFYIAYPLHLGIIALIKILLY